MTGDLLAIGGRWDLVFISIIFFAAFLLLIPFRKKVGWKAHGIYTAFIISLFTEMFGFPLTIYFISSYFASQVKFEDQFLNYMSSIGMPIGLIITSIGLLLVISGWRLIHKSHGKHITTTGIYRYVRHPQYLGFILITLGWLIHWSTIPTAIMWPILVILYCVLHPVFLLMDMKRRNAAKMMMLIKTRSHLPPNDEKSLITKASSLYHSTAADPSVCLVIINISSWFVQGR